MIVHRHTVGNRLTSLSPPADHRHSSHHIHRPLAKMLPEGRRKKGSKKRKKDRDHKSSHAPTSGPIEEGEDEEEEEEEGTEMTSAPSEPEKVKDVEVIIWLSVVLEYNIVLFTVKTERILN